VKGMKKREFYYIFLAILAGSFLWNACHSSKKVTKSTKSTQVNKVETKSTYTPVSVNDDSENSLPKRSNIKTEDADPPETRSEEKAIITTYADKLGVPKRDVTNYKLYHFVDDWYGTRYKYAGRSKSGVDCSDFVAILLKTVYNIDVSGAVMDIYKQCKPIKASELKEGDLVFFKINKKSLSHVGVYLQNHKFVHASVHAGVIIDDLGEDYYKKYYRAAGRIL